MKKYSFRKPDNWHAHLRQHKLLSTVYHHFNIYGRVLCMGNTKPLIETAFDAIDYRNQIKKHPITFEPVMTIMLTQNTTSETIFKAVEKGIKFIKFIPSGTSFGAGKGLRINDFDKLYSIFPAIVDTNMHLLLHAELISENGREIPPIEREDRAVAIVARYHQQFPNMKITVEHASTSNMIKFIQNCNNGNVRATLTPQHAILEYSDVFNQKGEIHNTINYCFPVAKNNSDKQIVKEAMISGDERFFAGTDAAPHWTNQKTGTIPPAGVFLGSFEYLWYLDVFEKMGAINKFENFTSKFGAKYYGYPLNEEFITIVKDEQIQPKNENGISFCLGGNTLKFKIIEE